MSSILVVDDEESMRNFLIIMLKKDGYEACDAENGKKALEILARRRFDLVITDLKMPGISGFNILNEVKKSSPETPVIMITAYGTTETAVEAMKKGAYDYITKPFKIDEVKLVIQKALEKKKLKEENIYLKDKLQEKYQFSNIIGKSDKMLKVFDMIKKVAYSNSTVLITGESGTGKELAAKAIHYNSPRKTMPFMSVSCGALPEQLLESELFGHVKGAFTSADSNKEGLLEVADGGSFFLDEIGESPLSIQVKLLRVLQERTFKRVGGVKEINVDVRIIAATNQNLVELVNQGKFREDMFYRLNVIPIELPPLREKKKDIPLLVNHFIKKFNKYTNKNIKGVSAEAFAVLERYRWPGNVRELENIIERAVVLETEDIIQLQCLPDEIVSSDIVDSGISAIKRIQGIAGKGIDLEKVLDDIERDIIIRALDKTNWVMKDAAELLHLNQRSMRYRIQKHAIEKIKRVE